MPVRPLERRGRFTTPLTVSNVRPRQDAVADEPVDLVLQVTNSADQEAEFVIDYQLNGSTVDRENIGGAFAHPPGETLEYSTPITPEGGFNEACVVLDNVLVGSFGRSDVGPVCTTFTAQEPAGGAAILVNRFNAVGQPFEFGQEIDVQIEFRNAGDASGTAQRDVLFNGETIGTATATIDPGQETTVTVSATVPTTEQLTVTVEGFGSIEYDVSPPDDRNIVDDIAESFGVTPRQLVLGGGAVVGGAGAIALLREQTQEQR